jgi:hypothetical protein
MLTVSGSVRKSTSILYSLLSKGDLTLLKNLKGTSFPISSTYGAYPLLLIVSTIVTYTSLSMSAGFNAKSTSIEPQCLLSLPNLSKIK